MQSASMATNSIILLLVLSISCLCSTRDVYIQPSEDEHCPGTCYNITTFGKMVDSFSNTIGLVVHFLEGTHLLDLQEIVVFTNLTNAVFEGDGRMEQGFHETVWQSTVVIKCTEHSSTGIAFVNSSNITFRYITITNCGVDMTGLAPRQFRQGHNQYLCNASLGYFSVSGVTVGKASIQNGSGSGLLAIVMKESNLTIANSSFTRHKQADCSVGGNILIYYTDPLNCSLEESLYKTLITNTNVSFGGIENDTDGGGLAIVMLQRTYSVDIVLDKVIAYKNRGFHSIWIVTESVDMFPCNLTINNSHISYGHSLAIGTFQTSSAVVHEHKCSTIASTDSFIIIANSKIVENVHRQHGKFGMFQILFEGLKRLPKIKIDSTEISHNQVFLCVLHILSTAYQRPQLYASLVNVIVNNNSLTDQGNSLYRPSAVRAFSVNTLTLNNVTITNNNMTGLWVFETAIVVNRNSTTVFHNNTGIDVGGGLIMIDDSYLVFEDHSIINFTKNSAEKGGAIYVENNGLSKSACFYQISDYMHPKSSKVYFSDNQASKAGTVLFGGKVHCDLFNIPMVSGREIFEKIFDYSAQTGPSVISSEPTRVCFCDDNNTINCSQTQLTMTAYPGEHINIYVVTVGLKNGVAPATLQIQPLLDKTINKEELHNTGAMECSTIQFTALYKHYSLKVYNMDENKLLNMSFSNCPLGFNVSRKTKACDCEETLKQTAANISCDAATSTITRKRSIWIGNISDCVIHSYCPFDYCNTAQVNFSLTDPDPQCALNRTGILCGRCQDGLTLALGSNDCIQCHGFSYLALIFPFAAAGFGLVALLMVLNLTVSIGTINGLIFYASIVKISESTSIFFPNGSIPILSQFVAWLNLDLGIDTCFYPHMIAYAKVWLQFVFPLYIWFIIATIIVLCRYSTWLSNKIGGNVVQVLATLILLSFTKIFRTAVLAIKFKTLHCNGNTSASVVVWYMDGNVPYLSLRHALLMAAAVLFLLIAVPYTLALLFDAVIEKYLTRIRFFRRQWIKFKPFVDAYHGPYKDKCRFWTGLLLLVRMAFTLVSLTSHPYTTLLFITTSNSVLLSLMVFFGGIYEKNHLNIMECLSLLNLSLLSAVYSTWYENTDVQQVVTIISVSGALVMFIGILFFHMFLHAKSSEFFKKFAITKKFRRRNNEESESLLIEEDYSCKPLVQPTSTDVWMTRESLIYS